MGSVIYCCELPCCQEGKMEVCGKGVEEVNTGSLS